MIGKLTQTFLRIYFRDRRAIVFSLFFPLIFMGIFGLAGNRPPEALRIGIADNAGNALSAEFKEALGGNAAFEILEGSEAELREQVLTGDLSLALVLPAEFRDADTRTELPVIVDAAQVRNLALILPVLEQALLRAERSLRGTEPLFQLKVEDVQARAQDYFAFVIPGLLAMSLMSINIAGSGFNIVEFRRKGILKRLFVTPIQPSHFIGGLVISRTIICTVMLSVVLAIAVFLMNLRIAGDVLSLYAVLLLGTAVFLGIGFCLGSLAKTQETIQAMGNLVTLPQMLLSGVFFPIDSLPGIAQPLAQALPLSFVANGFRDVIVNGESLFTMLPTLLGLVVWAVVAIALAIRMFVWKDVAG